MSQDQEEVADPLRLAQWTAELLTASQEIRVGDARKRTVTGPALQRLAGHEKRPTWEIEAVALEAGVIPLRLVRHVTRFGETALARFARSRVMLLGNVGSLPQTQQRLAALGVGRLELRRISEVSEIQELASSLRNVDLVVAALLRSDHEQLVQFACRMARVPVVFGAAQERRLQALAVSPGDPGVARIYRGDHRHVDPVREPTADEHAELILAGWMTDLGIRILAGESPATAPFLYADLDAGGVVETHLP